MGYQRPTGGSFTTKGPETDEEVRQGTTHTYTYEGTQAEMQTQRDIERSSGATRLRLMPSSDTGLWTLEASYPYGEDGASSEEPQDVHEIEVQVEQIPVWNSERLRDYLSDSVDGGTYNDISHAKTIMEGILRGDSQFLDTNNEPDWSSGGAIDDEVDLKVPNTETDYTDRRANMKALLRLVASGTESALEYREVYRRTITAADYTQVQASYEGVGKIWTTAEVESWEGVPNGEWFGLQAGMQYLKAPPTVQAVANGKTQIQYYYTEFKRATALLYQAYNSATLLHSSLNTI